MSRPTRAVAQGTFDILHPGHVHYLRDAASYGDELHVIVARGDNVTHKAPPILSDHQRVEMVRSLAVVDHARLGDPDDIFVPIEEIEPDVIVLGYDQHHDAEGIRAALGGTGDRLSGRAGHRPRGPSRRTAVDRPDRRPDSRTARLTIAARIFEQRG